MGVAETPTSCSRAERAESSRLAWALIISLAWHILVFGGYYTGSKLHWWESAHWPAWLQHARHLVEKLQKPPPPPRPQPEEFPLTFVEVNPAQATTEAPKNAKYYSNKNSQAANPDADKDLDIPKIDGKQNQVVKTEDADRLKPVPLQPSRPPAPPAPPAPEEQPEEKPKPALTPGELTVGKPEPTPRKDEGQAPRSRPRTVQEALARLHDRQLPGQKMQQEGGVKRRLQLASLDTKATPFGDYDAALIEAISQCWYNLLDAQGYAADYRGKVVLQFRLHADGHITNLTVAENTAGDIAGWICRTAIDKPNPYRPFPGDMRRVVGETRDVQFTFYYN